jgi:hypothetical protein
MANLKGMCFQAQASLHHFSMRTSIPHQGSAKNRLEAFAAFCALSDPCKLASRSELLLSSDANAGLEEVPGSKASPRLKQYVGPNVRTPPHRQGHCVHKA